MNQTGLLPSISWNGNRWWLPLSTLTANTLAQTFLVADTDTAQQEAICGLLRRDPALRIWALFQPVPTRKRESLSLDHLAKQTLSLLKDAYRSSNPLQDAPRDLQSFLPVWCQLYRDASAWEHAARWLEVTGPAIPKRWHRNWPQWIESSNNIDACPDYGGNTLDLGLLLKSIDRREQLNDQFASTLHHEKLAAMKELAYGLSHEINNPLANISTRAQTLIRDESSPDRKRMLAAIVNQAMRAYEMIADMMYYANPPRPNIEPVNVSELVLQVVDEFAPQCSAQSIAITSRIDSNCHASLDSHSIADVIRALLRNATEALASPGQIDVRLVDRGTILQLRISDNGKGMSTRERRHAFDPFFSGREAGRGLGLGLCKSQRIVELHGGTISIRSGPIGTIVIVSLPT